MRRLILEWSLKDASKILRQQLEKAKAEGRNPDAMAKVQQSSLMMFEMLEKIKSFEMLHILKQDEDGFAAIFRMELKDPSFKIEELLTDVMKNVNGKLQLLEHEEEDTYTYFIKGKYIQPDNGALFKKLGMYPFMPFTLRDGKLRFTLIGDDKQVKELLRSPELGRIPYKVISLTDAKFSPSSPISRLTEKQRAALLLAFNLGYFDTPRKISSEELAQKLGLANSTLAVHLRRAERRLLADMLSA